MGAALGADEFYCPDYKQENNRQHYRVLGDILGMCAPPNGVQTLSESIHLAGAGETIEVALRSIYWGALRATMARRCH